MIQIYTKLALVDIDQYLSIKCTVNNYLNGLSELDIVRWERSNEEERKGMVVGLPKGWIVQVGPNLFGGIELIHPPLGINNRWSPPTLAERAFPIPQICGPQITITFQCLLYSGIGPLNNVEELQYIRPFALILLVQLIALYHKNILNVRI